MKNCEFNYGLGLLKVIAAFLVVNAHFGSSGFTSSLAVPCFMLVAFYFTGKNINGEGLREWVRLRFLRLMVPFWIWSVLYWLILGKRFDWKMSVLLGQLIFGHTVCPPLYFIVLMVLFTLVVALIVRLCSRKSLLVIGVIGLICFWLTECEHHLFLKVVLPKEISYAQWPLGRIFELFPYAAIGFVFGRIPEEIISRYKWAFLVFMSMGLVGLILSGYHTGEGYYYQGAFRVLTSVMLCVFFYLLSNLIPLGGGGNNFAETDN